MRCGGKQANGWSDEFPEILKVHFNVSQNFSKQTPADILAGMHGYSRCASICMLESCVAALLPGNKKAKLIKCRCNL